METKEVFRNCSRCNHLGAVESKARCDASPIFLPDTFWAFLTRGEMPGSLLTLCGKKFRLPVLGSATRKTGHIAQSSFLKDTS